MYISKQYQVFTQRLGHYCANLENNVRIKLNIYLSEKGI